MPRSHPAAGSQASARYLAAELATISWTSEAKTSRNNRLTLCLLPTFLKSKDRKTFSPDEVATGTAAAATALSWLLMASSMDWSSKVGLALIVDRRVLSGFKSSQKAWPRTAMHASKVGFNVRSTITTDCALMSFFRSSPVTSRRIRKFRSLVAQRTKPGLPREGSAQLTQHSSGLQFIHDAQEQHGLVGGDAVRTHLDRLLQGRGEGLQGREARFSGTDIISSSRAPSCAGTSPPLKVGNGRRIVTWACPGCCGPGWC